MRYKGGKNGSGVFQRLISMMPPHEVYIELFLGSGAILRRKRLADRLTFGYELNPATIAEFCSEFGRREDVTPVESNELATIYKGPDRGQEIYIQNRNAIDAIEHQFGARRPFWFTNDPNKTLIYADPPYLMETRRSKQSIYQFEMFERSEHIRLLDLLAAVPCRVMISGYDSPLYNSKLKYWRREEIPTTNRAGDRVTEIVWLNFPEPFELHDYEHIGDDYRDRWRIEKRVRNWRRNWLAMPTLERYAILNAINVARAEQAAIEADALAEIDRRRQAIANRRHKANAELTTPRKALQDPEQPELL